MRKILTFLFSIAFCLFLAQCVNGQIINGDVFLGTPAQVDGFNSTQVNGTIIVTGSGITNHNG